MHVTFVSLGMELMGVESLSAVLKRHGHRTSLAHNPALFDDRYQLRLPRLARLFSQDDRIVEYILRLDPDLLAFSCLTPTFGWAVEIARRVRLRKRIPTVFGGVHPSAVPDFVLGYDEADFVCQGEGENALLRLVEALEAGRDGAGIANLWSKPGGRPEAPPSIDNFIQDLDALPLPDKDLYATAVPRRSIYNIMTARGCPYRCTFCFNNFYANLPDRTSPKEYLRRRSVENVMGELTLGKRKFDFRYVEFHDDIFTLDKAWLETFLPRFKEEIGVPWSCETHAKFMDKATARLMKESGCAAAKMGVQSMGELSYKSSVLKRAESEADIVKAVEACKEAGLALEVDHIFGLPGETPQAKERALEFYKRHTPNRIACFWLTYFPGIEMTRKAHERGELTDEHLMDIKRGEVIWFHEMHARTERGRRDLQRDVGYMIAFQILPSLPASLRRYVAPHLLVRIPLMATLSWLVMGGQMMSDWVTRGYFTAFTYLQLYLHNLFGPGRRLNQVWDPAPSDSPCG